MLTRERLLGLTARRFLTLECPNLGQVIIQSLTEEEASRYQSHVWTAKGEYSPRAAQDQRRRLIALMLVNPDHTRMLRDDDADALRGLDNRVISLLFAKCRDHAGMGAEESLEGCVKNSDEIDDDAQPST